jgi:hypothetical protein
MYLRERSAFADESPYLAYANPSEASASAPTIANDDDDLERMLGVDDAAVPDSEPDFVANSGEFSSAATRARPTPNHSPILIVVITPTRRDARRGGLCRGC